MKKPSAYLPFYGNDFFQSMEGYTDEVLVRYLRAIWHYWSHTGCDGLPDDDDYLRRVCDCQAAAWAPMKAIIFDNRYHFRLENGLWHQPRCREEWRVCCEAYEKKVRQTAAATRARTNNVT